MLSPSDCDRRRERKIQVWKKMNDEPAAARPPAEPLRTPAPPLRTPAPSFAASPPPTFAPPPKEPKPPAVIGSSMTVKGNIRASEELLVDGEVEGLLESQSRLTVGTTGKVHGNIKAREVVIFGSVHGNVEVSGKIAIRDQGSLIGDIKGAGISIDDGAYFKGSIDIVRHELRTPPKPAPASQPVEVPAA